MRYSSRAPGQGACLKGMSRTITMQAFTLAAMTDAEKTKLQRKNEQSQWIMESRCLLEGYAKDNNYTRFHTRSYH